MLKAIIFDCDGVIADTEPFHFESFKMVLRENNLPLTKRQYLDDYLAFDDKGCFMKAFATRGETLDEVQLASLIARKAFFLEPVLKENLTLFPGVAELVKSASRKYPLAIASGARRVEIEMILKFGQLQNYFQAIISTEDVTHSKPHPEAFIKAFKALRQIANPDLNPHECLVIEDSVNGVYGAQAAGMRCLAITNTYDPNHLTHADLTLSTLQGLSLQLLENLFPENQL